MKTNDQRWLAVYGASVAVQAEMKRLTTIILPDRKIIDEGDWGDWEIEWKKIFKRAQQIADLDMSMEEKIF
jgi:hypothetical protein